MEAVWRLCNGGVFDGYRRYLTKERPRDVLAFDFMAVCGKRDATQKYAGKT